MSASVSDDGLLEAAALAFAMLRFQEESAHMARGSAPAGIPRLGVDAYGFMPSLRRVPRDQVTTFLAGLNSPAVLVPSTTRGVVTLTLVDELSGDRAAGARHELDNQQRGLEEMITQAGLAEDATVLLDFDNEENLFSLQTVRVWAQRFVVHVGWSLGPLKNDPRATARIMLFASDGRLSFGEREQKR